ncbi:unnamed protein product, partial [Discosporangium mesarthrocarpum]
MSTVTALTVRTLLSSGIVIIFPLVLLLEKLGLATINLNIWVILYPWLGLPIAALRMDGKPITPFVMGHLAQVIVYYSVYNACLQAWSVWLYDKSMTTTLQVGT